MSEERFLVTGALGCIGAWTVRNLVKGGIATATLDLGTNRARLELLLSAEELRQVNFYRGDVTHLDEVSLAFDDFGPTHVIHLAALQLPFCKANPSLGAAVNVVGTVNMFEAVKRAGLKRLVYASSTAVYGLSDEYADEPLPNDAALKPRSHYGVYKQANEGSARVYWLEDGITSIGLRPYTVYGAGRDQGMTSTPTKAMLAAALGRGYHISYGGRCAFQYGDDVGKVFILAARTETPGAEVYNIGGASVSVPQVIAAIEQTVPTLRGQVTFTDVPLPFPPDVDNTALVAVLGALPETPLQQGVEETIALYRQAYADGRLSLEAAEAILK